MKPAYRGKCLGAVLLILALAGCGSGGSDPAGGNGAAAAPAPVSGTSISGLVTGENGLPVAGALVKIQATDNSTVSAADGSFTLAGLAPDAAVTVNAWKQGYYCAMEAGQPAGKQDVAIGLIRYQTGDNPDYEWIPPEGNGGCADCHPAINDIWRRNAHAGAARNPRFLTMYLGTDTDGNQSPPTRYEPGSGAWSGTLVPQPPDPALPYFGPGYLLDFPGTPGNCASCHTPGAAVGRDADPTAAAGADSFGVHCDFCHKIADVYLDEGTGLPFRHRPGTGSCDVRRPYTDDPNKGQLFFGTFDDVNAPKNDAYLPLIRESRFCAPCHFGAFWDTVVYNSYGEWMQSPYSNPDTGKTCQECHMPAPTMSGGQAITNIAPGKGGIERNPDAIHAHLQLGASDPDFMKSAVSMTALADTAGEALRVTVTIKNDRTGHHVPTDSPLRQMILVVTATDANGAPLALAEGPVLPEWCGEGDPADGNFAGLAGRAYAKILEELWTGVSPTGAYWNHTKIVSDNRIPAMGADSTAYTFVKPLGTAARVRVRLLYRRAFKALMEQKKWKNVPDVLMAEKEMNV